MTGRPGDGAAARTAAPRPAGRPVLIGLTGGIGSGKSAVARLLASLGAAVVDADAVARQVVEPGEPALARLVEAFGPEILHPDGTLDRRALGRRVFRDEAARRTLESIVHPAIRARTWEQIQSLMAAGRYPAVVWDVPLLFEVGAEGLVDQVWVVTAPQAVRLERLRRRDPDLSVEELERRMAAQMPLEEKAARAHVVIDNGGDWDATRRQVEGAWRRYVLGAPPADPVPSAAVEPPALAAPPAAAKPAAGPPSPGAAQPPAPAQPPAAAPGTEPDGGGHGPLPHPAPPSHPPQGPQAGDPGDDALGGDPRC